MQMFTVEKSGESVKEVVRQNKTQETSFSEVKKKSLRKEKNNLNRSDLTKN